MVSLLLFSSFVRAFCYYLERSKNVFRILDAKIPENEIIEE